MLAKPRAHLCSAFSVVGLSVQSEQGLSSEAPFEVSEHRLNARCASRSSRAFPVPFV